MKLDIRTLSFILCTCSIIQVIVIYVQARLNKKFGEIRYWVMGNLLNAIGILLVFARPNISNSFISIILSNMLIISGQLYIYMGILKFLNKKEKRYIIFSIALVSISAFSYFTYINDNLNCRIVIASLILALNALLIAFELLSCKNIQIRASVRFLGVLFLFYGIFYLMRSISAAFLNNVNDYFQSTNMQAGVFLISIYASYLSTFGLIIIVNQKISAEEKEAELKFKLANEENKVLSQAIEQSPASIVITDINENIEYVNKKFTAITGYTFEEAIGQNPNILQSGYHGEELYKNLWESILSGKEWNGEFRNKKKNGEFYWESAIISPIFDNNGDIKQILAIKEDITERKKLERALKIQARTDGLTGLSNRRYFMEAAEQELMRDKRYVTETAFLMLDIDFFKQVNDGFGHAVGDIAIKLVAKVCMETIRKTDILGRIGGEEFAVLLVETTFEDAIKTAERLRLNVENIELFDDNGNQVKLRISVGLTKYHIEGDSLQELLVRSDKALYRAKNEGRNRVVSIEN